MKGRHVYYVRKYSLALLLFTNMGKNVPVHDKKNENKNKQFSLFQHNRSTLSTEANVRKCVTMYNLQHEFYINITEQCRKTLKDTPSASTLILNMTS